jgi:hypothetical protein
MSKTLQFRRYPTSVLSTVTGANGEIIVDTTKYTLTVHDGTTPGGFPLVASNTSNNNANLTNLGVSGNVWVSNHILVGDSLTNAGIANVLNTSATGGQTGLKALNIIDTLGGIKIIRAGGNPFIEFGEWNSTLSTQAGGYDVGSISGVMTFRSRQLNYNASTNAANVVMQLYANTGTAATSNAINTGSVVISGGLGVSGNVYAISHYATSNIGFPTGTGSVATQATSRTTGVTLNNPTGQITLFNQAMATQTANTFVLTNSFIGANDFILLNHFSGGTIGAYHLASNTSAGQANVTIRNISSSTLTEAPVIQYVVIKAAAN